MHFGNHRLRTPASFLCFSVGIATLLPSSAASFLFRHGAASVARSPFCRRASKGFAVDSRSSTQATTTTSAKGLEEAAAAAMAPQQQPVLPPVPPTAKRLFLVRHGEVVNPGKVGGRPVYYGGMEVPLSSLGEEEAKVAASYLSQFRISRIFSSPLSRAAYGANQVLLLQQQQKQPSLSSSDPVPDEVIVLPGFTELDRGAWCGLTKEEIGADLLARFDACDETVTPEGGESYLDLKARVLRARDEALSQVPAGECACLVSHLQVTRSILSDALGVPTPEMVNLPVATASVACVDYDGPEQTVRFQSYKPDAGLRASRDGAN